MVERSSKENRRVPTPTLSPEVQGILEKRHHSLDRDAEEGVVRGSVNITEVKGAFRVGKEVSSEVKGVCWIID